MTADEEPRRAQNDPEETVAFLLSCRSLVACVAWVFAATLHDLPSRFRLNMPRSILALRCRASYGPLRAGEVPFIR
jgi:hypothetical protein